MRHAVDEQAIDCPVPETTMQKVETTSSNEVVSLQSRILSLELLVCELLTKNERLRIANSQLAHDSVLDQKNWPGDSPVDWTQPPTKSVSLNLLSPKSSISLSRSSSSPSQVGSEMIGAVERCTATGLGVRSRHLFSHGDVRAGWFQMLDDLPGGI